MCQAITASLRATATAATLPPRRAAIRSPQTNGYAERFVRTVRGECLDWLPILGRRHLEHVLSTYVTHYG